MERERGFDGETALQKCLLLGEEVGELFKAVRERTGIAVDANAPPTSIANELADVLNFLIAIANRFQIDLEEAYRAKEAANSLRRWK
jgi:NTP pyrophosphatase (non-canonical NTP hydrolase)